jgi:hypothetical protein
MVPIGCRRVPVLGRAGGVRLKLGGGDAAASRHQRRRDLCGELERGEFPPGAMAWRGVQQCRLSQCLADEQAIWSH